MEIALHSNWVGITAAERAMLGQALFSHFGGGTAIAPGLERLASAEALRRAMLWGLAIRLAQRLSGGVERPLTHTRLTLRDGLLLLELDSDDVALGGEVVERRLRHLAQTLGVKYRLVRGDG